MALLSPGVWGLGAGRVNVVNRSPASWNIIKKESIYESCWRRVLLIGGWINHIVTPLSIRKGGRISAVKGSEE